MKKILYFSVALVLLLALTSCINLTYNYYGDSATDTLATETRNYSSEVADSTESPVSDLFSEEITEAFESETETESITEEATKEATDTKSPSSETTMQEESESILPNLRYESLWIEDLTTPISINKTATISVFGKPGTYYMIDVYYSTKRSSAKGLEGKHADENGRVEWSWKIGASVKPGLYRIVVNGDEDCVETEIEILERQEAE